MKDYKSVYRCITTAIFSALIFLPGCAFNGTAQDDSKKIEKLKIENASLKRQIKILRRESQSTSVSLGSNPVLGKAGATLALIEFSDYFCPYCSRFHRTTFERIKKNYIDKGTLKYVYRDFPRGMAGKAVDAAIAVNCAGRKKAYWKMQSIVYRYSPRINRAFYKSTAISLGLNPKKYAACLDEKLQRRAIRRDFLYGRSLGINGTPTFFVGRVEGNKIISATIIVGAQPYANFAKTIDRLLDTGKKP